MYTRDWNIAVEWDIRCFIALLYSTPPPPPPFPYEQANWNSIKFPDSLTSRKVFETRLFQQN